MPRKPEYDFFDSDGLYKIYNKDDRNHIIAVCENVFDAQIVIKALINGLGVSPCDCVDEIAAAIEKEQERFDEEFKDALENAKDEAEEAREDAVSEALASGREEGIQQGREEVEANIKENIFDPS